MASEFVLVIPPEFDAALGIRTVQRHEAAPDYTRAVAGISEAGRKLMAALAKKAARKVRKPRKKHGREGVCEGLAAGTGAGCDGGREQRRGGGLRRGFEQWPLHPNAGWYLNCLHCR